MAPGLERNVSLREAIYKLGHSVLRYLAGQYGLHSLVKRILMVHVHVHG